MACQYKIDEMSLCSFDGECKDKGKFTKSVQYGMSVGKIGITVYGSCYQK
jgi:hypothetical protein